VIAVLSALNVTPGAGEAGAGGATGGGGGGVATFFEHPTDSNVRVNRNRSEKRFTENRFISETSVVIMAWQIQTMWVLRYFRCLSAEVPFSGVFSGKKGVLDFFQQIAASNEFHEFNVTDFIADGDKVVALGN